VFMIDVSVSLVSRAWTVHRNSSDVLPTARDTGSAGLANVIAIPDTKETCVRPLWCVRTTVAIMASAWMELACVQVDLEGAIAHMALHVQINARGTVCVPRGNVTVILALLDLTAPSNSLVPTNARGMASV
jgi:hypothetical protein